jgi:histidinol phosphatase-like PHP family hydrolase
MTWEEDADELRVYMIAKEMGCKFYFGSDAHTVPGLGWAKRNAERIIDLLSLEEDDKFIL